MMHKRALHAALAASGRACKRRASLVPEGACSLATAAALTSVPSSTTAYLNNGCSRLQQVIPCTFGCQAAAPNVRHLTCSLSAAQEVGSPMDTQGSSGTSKDLSDADFHRHADLSIGDLFSKLEELVEEAGFPEADLEYSQGVLTLELGKHGTYVINKQSPNRQLWMSSPVSGPIRYDWNDGLWEYKHDGHKMHTRLQTELQKLLNRDDIDLEPELVIGYGPDVT